MALPCQMRLTFAPQFLVFIASVRPLLFVPRRCGMTGPPGVVYGKLLINFSALLAL